MLTIATAGVTLAIVSVSHGGEIRWYRFPLADRDAAMDYTDILASEVMQRSVDTVSPDMTLSELERAFLECGVSGFPVVENDDIVGVISRSDVVRQLFYEHDTAERTSDFYRDAEGFHELPLKTPEQIAARVGERIESLKVRDIMHRGLFAVPPEQPLRAVAQTIQDNRIHRVLVTREGRLLGVISASDFVRLYATGRIRAE